MKVTNFDLFAKQVMALSVVALLAGCGDEPEKTAGQKQTGVTAGVVQNDEVVAGATPAESDDVVEEESLESILAKADEIIQRTGASNGNAEPEPQEVTGEAAEETMPATVSASQAESAGDDKKVIKTTPELIRKVQQALKDAGLNPGAADGKLGPRSRNALADFQKQHGLAEGKITGETLRALGIDF